VTTRARVTTRNNFPTGAGLASSASGYAALVRAGEAALKLDLSPRERSIVARQGSGSAARSIFGGFVEMHAGSAPDGSDSFAEPLLEASEWPLEVVIAVTAKGEKEVGSRSGMTRSAASSPYYAAWVAGQPADLAAARTAIRARDFAALAELAEHNCLKMHAAALSARPPLVYWNGATVECLHAVQRLRAQGCPTFFTIDAGPQVKAVCAPGARSQVAANLRAVPGVQEILTSALGPGAERK
jgi:diphosphomevalonate decarboxylase